MKYIKDLTNDELKKVYENNNELQEKVFDALLEHAYFWIDEYTNEFDRNTFELNVGYPGNYITVKENESFIRGCKKVQECFEIFSYTTFNKVLYCEKLMGRWWLVQDEKNEHRINNRIDELIDDISDAFLDRLVDEYNAAFNDENLIDYWVNFLADNYTCKDYFVDDNYILYEHVDFIKSYNRGHKNV